MVIINSKVRNKSKVTLLNHTETALNPDKLSYSEKSSKPSQISKFLEILFELAMSSRKIMAEMNLTNQN